MENKLDILTKKLYDEGVEKAKTEGDGIIGKAQQEAELLVAEAKRQAEVIIARANEEADSLKKKAEAEMVLSARQAVTALKQSVTNLITAKVAGEMAKSGFNDKTYVQELLMTMIKGWDVASGSLDLDVVLPAEEKARFESFVAGQYKELLDKGLGIKVGNLSEEFVIQPKDGGYQIVFSEALFEAFFSQYMKSFTKTLLY